MGKLQALMQREMELKGYSGQTIHTYLVHMRRYTQYLCQPPDQAGQEDVKRYLITPGRRP